MIALPIPAHADISAQHMYRDLLVRQPVQYACHRRRTAARAAGKRLARATLPDAHIHAPPVIDPDELRIYTTGKCRRDLKVRSVFLHIARIGKYHRMRIAHRHAGHVKGSVKHLKRLRYDISRLLIGPEYADIGRHLSAVQYRLTHIDGDLDSLTVLRLNRDIFDPAEALYSELRPVRHMMVVYILRHTSYAVAAHLRARAVRIVHLHLKIGYLRRIDEYQSVRAYAEMPLRQAYRQLRLCLLIYIIAKAVDIYIVIAAAVHLGKFNSHDYPPYPRLQPGASSPVYTWYEPRAQPAAAVSHIFLMRSIASFVASWAPNAVSLKYPSPLGPKPAPGVPTTCALESR